MIVGFKNRTQPTCYLLKRKIVQNTMNNSYFSDLESGPKPRIKEDITSAAWGGISSVIESSIDNGAFGLKFPDKCPDGGIIGTNRRTFYSALNGDIENLPWPLTYEVPHTLQILDIVKFCHSNIAKPGKGDYHKFPQHYHLNFDQTEGQSDFREKINQIFSRNGLVYELQENGQIIRLGTPILREVLQSMAFNTGDSELDSMLEKARSKYFSPDLAVRRESLEKLWDAWERLKTTIPGKNTKETKRAGIEELLRMASPESNFRKMLADEATELTRIGNDFQIRHSETYKTPIDLNEHIDYLFHRLFAMIHLILKRK